jgi:uncharacterized protein DUF4129
MPLQVSPALVALMALLLILLPRASRAQQPLTPEQAVEAGQRALSQSGRVPWYDRSKDDVRQLHVLPRDAADSKNRNSNWTKDQTLTPRGRLPRISFFGSALQWLGLTVLIVLLVVIAFLIAKAFLKEEISDDVVLRKVVESSRDADRVEALPFAVRKPTSDFLAEARRLYEAGDYSEAIIYLFSYELVQLDRQHLIRLTKGKTNRQYLRELRQRPHLRAILETTVINFEDAFFGRKTLTRERFERSWQQVDDFHRELERLERAAA